MIRQTAEEEYKKKRKKNWTGEKEGNDMTSRLLDV